MGSFASRWCSENRLYCLDVYLLAYRGRRLFPSLPDAKRSELLRREVCLLIESRDIKPTANKGGADKKQGVNRKEKRSLSKATETRASPEEVQWGPELESTLRGERLWVLSVSFRA